MFAERNLNKINKCWNNYSGSKTTSLAYTYAKKQISNSRNTYIIILVVVLIYDITQLSDIKNRIPVYG